MKYVIGIDLGGTKIEGVLMNDKDKVVKLIRRPTEVHKGKKQVIKNILEAIKDLKIKKVKAIGIGIPGFANQKGKIIHMPNIPKLVGINLQKELKKKIKDKVVVENDANCFALAEQRLGAAKGYKNVVGVIIGTGVGAGIIINNRIYSGSSGGAGEAGEVSVILHRKSKEIEDLISGPAILKRYEELSKKKVHTPAIILNERDKVARKVYREVVHNTGLLLATLINILNPECIVLGGGVSNLHYSKEVKKIAREHSVPVLAKACKIKNNLLGDYSGVIGAAMLALE